MEWLTAKKPPGAAACAVTVLTALTVLIGAIAVRTVIAVRRGQLFPAPPPAAAAGLEHGTQPSVEPARA